MTITQDSPARHLTLAEEVALTKLPEPHIRRAIRKAARVSLRRLAREIGVSHGSIAYYERGGQPGVEIAIRYREELERLAGAAGFQAEISKPE
ncbi:MAG TPA: helix-turn-helix transcriptional regulator [Candidatus Dormibacteraeota bacterium]|jgi:DNA-binding XRE family transcriptional regulator